ncbi:MAG: hypothetical protein ACYS5W_14075 [Planctomycetota bacterium]
MNRPPHDMIRTLQANRTMRRCLAVSFVALLATAASAQGPAKLASAKQSHALELARLSDSCAEKKLLNDADRLLRAALRVVPGDQGILQRQKQLRELWISVNRDREKGEIYKGFWKSKAYEAACTDLRKREGKVRRGIIESYLELARGVKSDDAEVTDAALRMAFDVDPTSSALAARAGAERVEKLRRQRPGLAALQLGETVVGKPANLQHLHGKVVLWRSFSL